MLPSSAYSRRTRWPSFFSRQIEKPGYFAAAFPAVIHLRSSTGSVTLDVALDIRRLVAVLLRLQMNTRKLSKS